MGGNDEATLAELMRRANAGDETAYGEALGRVAIVVRGMARRASTDGRVADPEDIVQETLLAIHRKRHTWRQTEPILPWVYAIARYKLLDALRRRGRRLHVHIDEVADSLAAPETERVAEREVVRALDGLATRQRAVVEAIAVKGLSVGDAAARLGMSRSAVRVALHRGLTAIAARFGRN